MENEEYINDYPILFRDDIDKWLLKEFGILGGACSAQGSLEYNVARMVVEKLLKCLWKPADGDDLPEIDREVIALLDNGKVVYAHRPPEHWDGKDIVTGKVTRYYPKTYDKGGWNIPDVKYWLDVVLPKE